jgi:hypothetical protein
LRHDISEVRAFLVTSTSSVEDCDIVAPVDQVQSSCTCSKTEDVILPETPESSQDSPLFDCEIGVQD